MTFATEILKPDSEKFALVKIEAKKLLRDETYLGSNQYQYTVPADMNIYDIQIFPVDDNPTWTYSGTTLVVTTTKDLTLDTNYAILWHYLYLTGDKIKTTSSVSGVDDATWLPRLLSYPSSTQTMQNIADGVFSLSNSNIEVITTDGLIQNFLGENDSFSDCDVRVWMCVNEAANNRVIFDGKIISVNIANGVASFSVIDSFLKLNDTGRFGTYDQSYIKTGGTLAEFPDVSDVGNAAPISIGNGPLVLQGPLAAQGFTTGGIKYLATGGNKLVLDAPSSFTAGSTVTFFAGRFVGTALKYLTFGSVTRCYQQFNYIHGSSYVNGTYVYNIIYHIKCANFYGNIGDCLPDGLTGVDTNPMWITRISQYSGPDGSTYDFSCTTQFNTWNSPSAPGVDGLVSNPTIASNTYFSYSVFRRNLPTSMVFDTTVANTASSMDAVYYLNGYSDTGTTTVTPSVVSLGTIGGVTVSALYITVDFDQLSQDLPFDPKDYHNWYCTFTPSAQITHGDAMKFLIKSSGLDFNAASATTADSDLSANVSMTFPFDEQKEFATYLEYAQYLAKSSFSLLRVNTSREIVYEILKNPNSVALDHTRNDADILVNSCNSLVDYNDIYSEVYFENPQFKNIHAVNGIGPAASEQNLKAIYLHESYKVKTYKHGLEDIQGRYEDIAAYFSEPKVEYVYETASTDLATLIGDTVSLTDDSIANAEGSVIGLVTEITNSPSTTTIKTNELRGVP